MDKPGIDLSKKLIDKQIDGTVEAFVVGGPPKTVGCVKGDTVYQNRIGGPSVAIGFVKDGKAYENVIGGPPRYIGDVKYNKDK